MSITYLARLLILVSSFVISFWALGALNFEKCLKANHVQQAQVLYWLMSFALAYLVSGFITSLLYWA
jgi:uncharacterized integral membrane protein (TIGR02327 family)